MDRKTGKSLLPVHNKWVLLPIPGEGLVSPEHCCNDLCKKTMGEEVYTTCQNSPKRITPRHPLCQLMKYAEKLQDETKNSTTDPPA